MATRIVASDIGDRQGWPARWVLVLGSVTRIGGALLTKEMVKGGLK